MSLLGLWTWCFQEELFLLAPLHRIAHLGAARYVFRVAFQAPGMV